MQFRIFKYYYVDSFIYFTNALRNFISKLFKRNQSQEVPYSRLHETSSPESSEASALEENLEETSDFQVGSVEITSKRTKKNRSKARSRKIISMSEKNRLRTLEKTFEEEFETALTKSRLHSKPKSSRITSLRSVSVPDYSRVANAEGTSNTGTTAKFRTLGNKKVRKKGRKITVCVACKGHISEIFQEEGYEEKITFIHLINWIEEMIVLLKSLSSTSELTSDVKKIIIGNVLEDVKKANRPITSKTESMNVLIKMIENTALSLLLDINKTANNLQGINCLASILRHLSATAGTKITSEEVQKCINSDPVLNLYEVMQEERKPILNEIETMKKYIEHGTEEVLKVKESYKEHFESVKDVFSKGAAHSNLQEMNLKLKTAAAVSEEFLNQYGNSIGYLVTKAEALYNSKVEAERMVTKFLTQKIEHLFKGVR